MKWISLFFILFAAGCSTPVKQQESASLHLQLALGLIEKENYPSALKELLVAQDLDSHNPFVQFYLGYVYSIRERFDFAEQHYKKALDLKSDFTEARNNLARVYIEVFKYPLAQKELNIVLQDYTYNNFAGAYFNYGLLEFQQKNYKQALTYFYKNLEKDRENCMSHVYVGRSYLELLENAMAVDELNKAIGFCESHQIDDAHYYDAIALYRNNQKDLAVIRFEELLKLFPTGKNRENAKKMISVIRKGNL